MLQMLISTSTRAPTIPSPPQTGVSTYDGRVKPDRGEGFGQNPLLDPMGRNLDPETIWCSMTLCLLLNSCVST